MLITFVTSIETMDSLHSPESSILALKLLCFLHDHKPFVLYIITGCHVPSCTASALDKRPARIRGTHSTTTTSRLCGLMRTCIAAIRKVSHVFIYTYKLKVSGAHAPLGPTVDTPLPQTLFSGALILQAIRPCAVKRVWLRQTTCSMCNT